MVITQQVVLDEAYRTLAFCGGMGRGFLRQKIARELVAKGKKVLMLSSGLQHFPGTGEMVVCSHPDLLVKVLHKKFDTHHLLYAANRLEEQYLQGFPLEKCAEIRSLLPDVFLLLELGNSMQHCFNPNEDSASWQGAQCWDQLIYLVDIQRMDSVDFESQHSVCANLQTPGNSPETMLEYLTDRESGVKAIFEQAWPAMLVFAGADMPARENRAITFSRELFAEGIFNVAVGDLQTNLIKRLPAI